MNSITPIQIEQIRSWINYYRGQTIDAVEQEMVGSLRWPQMRNRLLKIFGDRGLEEKILSILDPGRPTRGVAHE
jgi:hypothetical protein